MNPEVKKYVDAARLVGKPDAQIAQDLRGGGWSEAEISAGITGVPSAVVSESGKGTKVSTILIVLVVLMILPTFIGRIIFMASGSTNNYESDAIVLPPLPEEDKEESAIRYKISFIRVNAEDYFDSNNKSYAGMCATNKDPFAQAYKELKSIPKVEIKCNSTQYEYAVSVKAASGKFWCADSTGYAGEISENHSGTVCINYNY